MKTLTVALPGREYDILIERGLLNRAGEHLRAVLPGLPGFLWSQTAMWARFIWNSWRSR